MTFHKFGSLAYLRNSGGFLFGRDLFSTVETMEMKQQELDLEAGVKARDEGMKSVADNSEPWFQRARRYVEKRAAAQRLGIFTGEFLRDIIEVHVGAPHHPNALGALVSRLVKDGVIVPTGRMVPSVRKTSHAHATPEYRSVP